MYRFATLNNQLLALLFVMAALMSWTPMATAADNKTQPITITADSAELSRPNNISIYTGNVVLERGGLTLTGDKLVITRIEQNAYKAVLTGTPATLERIPPANDAQVVTGHGDKIIYFSNNSEMTLRGQAVVKRDGDIIHSEVIHHDLDTRRTTAGNASSDQDRVTITLHPGEGKNAE